MMYYKVEAGALLPAPKNITLPDGKRVFNFDKDEELLALYGYVSAMIEGEATLPYEWYEQIDGAIIHHPALIPEPSDDDDLTADEALTIIMEGVANVSTTA